ncbi:AMP-binding enzyme [Tepidibacillus marianensis]|uniref:AMP-binding enzyme n=1 Tax=Tepidibacillus marianensis TaxID=3131995 RepID=UPI0030D0206D
MEEALFHIDGVVDVAVISRPHEEWGETVMAIIVKKDNFELNEDMIKGHLKDRLAKFKIPRDYIFVSDLPRNASGKIIKTSPKRTISLKFFRDWTFSKFTE